MIEIKKKYELRGLNTLKIRCKADYFCEAFSTEDCIEALSFASDNKIPFLVIGGGTNIVFSQNFEGLVVKNSIMHRSIIENNVVLGSGESWHNSVLWTIKNNLYGLENLSLIPGSVGAAPEADENDFKKQGLGYDPLVKRWRRIKPGDDLSGHHHHRGEFASPGQPCPVCTSPLKKVHNATLYGGVVAIGFRCGVCTYLTGHRWREPSRYLFRLKGGK